MIDTVIFNLNQTLLDSRISELKRDSCNWSAVYSLIPAFAPYPGIDELLRALVDRGVKLGIVSSCPRPYIEETLRHFGWNRLFRASTCFHDTRRRSPYPDPILDCLKRLKSTPASTVFAGDRARDIFSSASARVYSIGCVWGSSEPHEMVAANPSRTAQRVRDLQEILLAIT